MDIASLIKQPAAAGGIETQLNSILRAVRTHLGMEVAFISEFSEGRRVFRQVDSAEGKECIEVGGSDLLEESYCHWIAEGRLPRLMRDPAKHPFAASFPATHELPVGAHISIPIRLRDGRVYGTFCCFSFSRDLSLTERDLATMEAFAQVARDHIQENLDREREAQRIAEQITSIIENGDLEIVYQPAIRIDLPRVEFVEALSRFSSQPYESPDRWFSRAAKVGLGTTLELLPMRLALDGRPKLPPGSSISINLSPEAVLSEEFAAVMEMATLDRTILEITEHEAVHCYADLIEVMKPFRKRGLRLAVDDTGAGYSSFRHILLLQPDIIKLDISLARNIDSDPARRALAAALITFAREIGSELVAEGVETVGELRSLQALGVNIIQGHILARPAPPGDPVQASAGNGGGYVSGGQDQVGAGNYSSL